MHLISFHTNTTGSKSEPNQSTAVAAPSESEFGCLNWRKKKTKKRTKKKEEEKKNKKKKEEQKLST